jgi:hypothetical protein
MREMGREGALNKFDVLLQKLLRFMETKKNFKIYFSEEGDLELVSDKKGSGKENCKMLLNYLIKHKDKIFSETHTLKDFDNLRLLVDNVYLYRKLVDKNGELEPLMLQLRLGGNIPHTWLKENFEFRKFIKSNYLHHRFFALRIPLKFDAEKGAMLPFARAEETVWIAWNEIKNEGFVFKKDDELLFETNKQYVLLNNYTVLHQGFTKYNVGIDPKWEPFMWADPREWGQKYVLEVWTVSLPEVKPPMFQRTHAYIVLKDNEGRVRSVGQDVLVDRDNFRITEILNRKPGFGKITTPDIYTFYPLNARRFWHTSIEITKEEHDRVISIVEKDKANKEHSMSVLKGNCVSYVLKILRLGLGLEVNATMHGLHVMLKAWLPNSWYRAFFKKFDPWYSQRSDLAKKGLYFLPFVYIPYFLLGIAALFTRQNNYQEIRDFSFLDLIIRPWKLSCEHPLALHRKLDEVGDLIPKLRSLYNKAEELVD